jgi:hypothetical protein
MANSCNDIYFAHGGFCRWPHSIILEREGPNDGLVSVESSKWVRLFALSLLPIN